MEFLHLSKDPLVNWLLLPQVELVSDLEDDVEVAMAKVREQRWREEEAERQEEEVKSRGGPKAGGVQGRDGTSDGDGASMGGS